MLYLSPPTGWHHKAHLPVVVLLRLICRTESLIALMGIVKIVGIAYERPCFYTCFAFNNTHL